jgi:asparagine synthase (glutamine-hydrolysing)
LRRWVTGGRKAEKQLLRDAFAQTGILPWEIISRKKEAFSDGVSGQERSWFEEIQDRIHKEGLVPTNWKELSTTWNPRPLTEEAYWYRTIFNENYIIEKPWPYWMPRWSKTTDPSARTL